jgi:hypothetical protein
MSYINEALLEAKRQKQEATLRADKSKANKMSAIYLVNQSTAHTALSTILAEYRGVLTYRRLYNHVWDKPLIAEGLTVVKIPLVRPCRNREGVVY